MCSGLPLKTSLGLCYMVLKDQSRTLIFFVLEYLIVVELNVALVLE